MSCSHRNVVDVFTESAVCIDCGAALCRNCRREPARPELGAGEICSVFFWKTVLETDSWRGRATSREDAQRALASAQLVCEMFKYRGPKPIQHIKHPFGCSCDSCEHYMADVG